MAYNFAKKLNALRFRSPYEKIIDDWKADPSVFHTNRIHHTVGLNI